MTSSANADMYMQKRMVYVQLCNTLLPIVLPEIVSYQKYMDNRRKLKANNHVSTLSDQDPCKKTRWNETCHNYWRNSNKIPSNTMNKGYSYLACSNLFEVCARGGREVSASRLILLKWYRLIPGSYIQAVTVRGPTRKNYRIRILIAC